MEEYKQSEAPPTVKSPSDFYEDLSYRQQTVLHNLYKKANRLKFNEIAQKAMLYQGNCDVLWRYVDKVPPPERPSAGIETEANDLVVMRSLGLYALITGVMTCLIIFVISLCDFADSECSFCFHLTALNVVFLCILAMSVASFMIMRLWEPNWFKQLAIKYCKCLHYKLLRVYMAKLWRRPTANVFVVISALRVKDGLCFFILMIYAVLDFICIIYEMRNSSDIEIVCCSSNKLPEILSKLRSVNHNYIAMSDGSGNGPSV